MVSASFCTGFGLCLQAFGRGCLVVVTVSVAFVAWAIMGLFRVRPVWLGWAGSDGSSIEINCCQWPGRALWKSAPRLHLLPRVKRLGRVFFGLHLAGVRGGTGGGGQAGTTPQKPLHLGDSFTMTVVLFFRPQLHRPLWTRYLATALPSGTPFGLVDDFAGLGGGHTQRRGGFGRCVPRGAG